MAVLLKHLYENYIHVMYDLTDPRVKNWPLMLSPIPLTTILVIYYLFVTTVGPEFMKNRKPYNLRKAIIIYNAFQVFINFSLAASFTSEFFNLNYSCSEVDYSIEATPVAFRGYLYFLIKLVDLLDTVFFVLRKKSNQITFLHTYHHGMVTACSWIGTKYIGGGHTSVVPYINTWVHVFMYSYYLASIVSNNAKSVIWWKKYLTQLQLAQFAILLCMHLAPMFHSSCNYPKSFLFLIQLQSVIMLKLFGNFYYKAYIKKKKTD